MMLYAFDALFVLQTLYNGVFFVLQKRISFFLLSDGTHHRLQGISYTKLVYHILLHHIVPYHILLYHILLYHILLYHVVYIII